MSVLVVNIGSSSLKVAVFDIGGSVPTPAFRATVTTRGTDRTAVVQTGATGAPSHELVTTSGRHGLATDLDWLVTVLDREGLRSGLAAVGHRLVHGGPVFKAPVWLDSRALDCLRSLVALAPDHLPLELSAIDAVAHRLPGIRQAACFDTAFHSSLPDRARLFGIPRQFSDRGVMRYGFHGLSCEHVVSALRSAGRLGRRVVIAHLGSGASLTAVLNGSSVDTSMGFTPAGGIPMSTRSGDLDPGVLLYLARECGLDLAGLNRAVNVEGGLTGISGMGGDMRQLLEYGPSNPRAADAVEIFCYQVRKMVGAYAAALDGLDDLVFTGGIGEHAAAVRESICNGLAWYGIVLDAARNSRHESVISVMGAAVTVRIVPADEEAVIARHVGELLKT